SHPFLLHLFPLLLPPPPRSTLFPYTTLFRSCTPHEFQNRLRRPTCGMKMIPLLPAQPTLHLCQFFNHRSPVWPLGNYFLQFAYRSKSTRLNSSHVEISYAVFCLKKKIKRIKT